MQVRTWDWGDTKLEIHRQLQISDDALHVHVGLTLLIVAALLLRRPPWSRWPVLIVATIEGVNEIYDMASLGHRPNNESALPDSIHDFVLTMLWPIVLLVLVPLFQRYARRP